MSKPSKRNTTQTERVERPNKTQGKRDMEGLKLDAAQLLELKEAQIKTLTLQPALIDAIEEMKRIKNHNARNRHLQYIVRLLADQNNIEDIQQQLYLYANPHLAHQKLDKKVEELVQGALEGGKDNIDIILQNPKIQDRQKFLQTWRNAQKEFIADLEKSNDEEGGTLKAAQGKQVKKFKQLVKSLL